MNNVQTDVMCKKKNEEQFIHNKFEKSSMSSLSCVSRVSTHRTKNQSVSYPQTRESLDHGNHIHV